LSPALILKIRNWLGLLTLAVIAFVGGLLIWWHLDGHEKPDLHAGRTLPMDGFGMLYLSKGESDFLGYITFLWIFLGFGCCAAWRLLLSASVTKKKDVNF
jgi:hypothetical protein